MLLSFHPAISTAKESIGMAIVRMNNRAAVRSFTGMDRNGQEWTEIPEWTFACAPEYFLCTLCCQSCFK